MKPADLDLAYSQICQRLTSIGEAKAQLYLARFALLAMVELNDLHTVQRLIEEAGAGLTDQSAAN
ncbi:MAG: hypothetical protein KG075_23435 [Alphaproteobacteria bacterium]|nr:hypothetical protein [Alphaproteobacteria bacterium]